MIISIYFLLHTWTICQALDWKKIFQPNNQFWNDHYYHANNDILTSIIYICGPIHTPRPLEDMTETYIDRMVFALSSQTGQHTLQYLWQPDFWSRS